MSNTLIILVLPSGSRGSLHGLKDVSLESGDITVMMRSVIQEKSRNDYKVHIFNNKNSYLNKRNADTVWATGSDIDGNTLLTIENTCESFELHCFTSVEELRVDIAELGETLREAASSDEIPTPLLDKLLNTFETGGSIQGRILKLDGTIGKLGNLNIKSVTGGGFSIDYDDTASSDEEEVSKTNVAESALGEGEPEANEPIGQANDDGNEAAVAGDAGNEQELEDEDDSDDDHSQMDWAAITENKVISLINNIMPAIAYDGFSPGKIRMAFRNRSDTPNSGARDLMLCFAAYSNIGNNIGKLSTRRVDSKISKLLMDAVKAMNVKKSDRSSGGLTLPRLAISFMPEYLAYRKFIAKDLQSQTSSTISVEFKDIVFYGCESIRNKTGYPEFHKEFSSYIFNTKPGEEVTIDDVKFVKNYDRWNKVTIAGYLKDTKVHARMNTVLAWTNRTPVGVFRFFVEGLSTGYD